MLYLTYSGYNYSKKRCERIVNWFVDKHLSNYKLIINVDHKGILHEGVFGWMWAADCDYRPRDFEVELHYRMTPELYTKTLLHELWHVYQQVTGQIKDKFKKRLRKGVDHSKTAYEDQPWEVEANRMEELLYEEYTTYLSTSNLKL